MQRDTAVAVVLALLALLAIGAAAATLENPAATEGEPGIGPGSGGGVGGGTLGGNESGESDPTANVSAGGGLFSWTGEIGGACIAVLQTLRAKLLIAGGVAALAGLVWWRSGSFGAGALTACLTGSVAYVMWFALAGCQTLQEGMLPRRSANRTGPGNETGGGSLGAVAETTTSQPSVLLAIVLAVLVLGAVVLLYVASDDDVDVAGLTDGPDEDEEEADIAAVGRVAGEAADRIETGDAFDNEVYRAWAEMTEHLAVDHPESSTPAEFASAAVDAGMAPDDVNELTDLFEEVRYGDREVTAERERRATEALRRIEASYAEGEE